MKCLPMKLNYSSIISALLFLLLMQVSHFAKADTSMSYPLSQLALGCENAVPMNCRESNYLKSEFLKETNSTVLVSQESCIEAQEEGELGEYWLSISLSGLNIYYLDGLGVNAGMEIYTGTCGDLVMVECENVVGDNSFISLSPSLSTHYYIRLLGYGQPDQDDFEVVINCGIPEPACTVSIEDLVVGACVNDSGTVSLFMSGLVDPEPIYPVIYAEVLTDMGFYAFSGESVNGLWEASFEVRGTVVNYVSVFCGNSESGCSDSRAGMTLPTVLCNSLSSPNFIGSLDWDVNCGSRSGEVKLYEPGTDILVQSYSVYVQSNGLFEIENLPVGSNDMTLKVAGFLVKGFSNVETPLAESFFDCGSLSHGDLNGDGFINLLDIVLIVNVLNTVLPHDNSLNHFDQNCDGVVDNIDLTSMIASFGGIGDTVPLE